MPTVDKFIAERPSIWSFFHAGRLKLDQLDKVCREEAHQGGESYHTSRVVECFLKSTPA